MACGAPQPGRGLPTGAPLSPLLGNLLLDRFDEQIAAEGCRLVRYGDDFLVLCRSQAQAEALHSVATAAADKLRLALNDAEPQISDFHEPCSYHRQFVRQARGLRRYLIDPGEAFEPFAHP